MCIFASSFGTTSVVTQRQIYEIYINIYEYCHDSSKVLTIGRENIDIAGHHSPQAGERHPSASRTECRTPSTARQVTSQTGDTAHGQPQGCTRPATEPQPPIAQKTLPVGRATAYHSQTVGPLGIKKRYKFTPYRGRDSS